MLPIVASVAGYELTDAEKYWLAKNQPEVSVFLIITLKINNSSKNCSTK